MNNPVVFFDLESDSLRDDCQIIQIGAVAARGAEILGQFECKIQFDEARAEPDALALNGYSREAWADALPQVLAANRFAAFLEPYRHIQKISRAGKPYRVAQLAGYNAAAFDAPRIQRFYKDASVFLAADYKVLDVFQLVQWYYYANPGTEPRDPESGLPSLKLGRVCEAWGIPLENAHDALADVIATAKLAHAILARGAA